MDATAFPKGFQGLIGAQNMGVGLRASSDFIQPTLELFDMLGLSSRGTTSGLLNPVVAAATQQAVIPQGEYWFLRQATLEIQTAAAESVAGATLLATDPNTASNSFAFHITRGIVQGASTRSIEVAYPNVLYGPGTQFGIRGGLVVGVPIGLMTLLYDRLKA